MADTWDEVACRARLAAAVPDFAAWQELVRHTPTDLRGALAALDVARAECGQLRAALIRIQGWDCLNPPRQDLLHDLPWLRRLVDEALGAGQGRPDLGGRP
jgi:hypothetical protein